MDTVWSLYNKEGCRVCVVCIRKGPGSVWSVRKGAGSVWSV